MFGDSRTEAFAFVIFEHFVLFLPTYSWEKVRTTNFTTSKTKKNIEKLADDHNIEKIY